MPNNIKTAAPPRSQPTPAEPKPPEVAELLARVEQFLQTDQAEQARELLVRNRSGSVWIANALGVCQLRLHNAKAALDLFRGLVIAAGGFRMRDDVPPRCKRNYATALLAAGNIPGCQTALAEIDDEAHPSVQKLRGAIKRWLDSLSFWQRLNWYLGGHPEQPVTLEQPLGELQ